MGLGGGFLATVYDAPTGRVRVVNARERAPAATHEDQFANASSTVGGLAIAVPGELRGYGELYRAYGRLPWAELVRPTADLCRRGHRVNSYMGRVLHSYSDRIKAEPSMRLLSRVEWQEPIAVPVSSEHTLYSVPLPGSGSVLAFILNMLRDWVGAGTAAPEGSTLYWHRIIETFKYAYAKRTGLGDASRSDLAKRITQLERNLSDPAWARSYRDLVDDARTFPDWQHYGASFEGADDHGTAHIVVVAPDGSVVSATSTINYMCTVAYFPTGSTTARRLKAPTTTAHIVVVAPDGSVVHGTCMFPDWQHYDASFEGADDHGTAHIVVVAPDGSVVSATSTINYIWGSQRRSRSLGIMLNNEMDDFAIPNRESAYGLPPSPANLLAPGLQPLSSMTPSIVLKNNRTLALVVGAAGGTKITTQVSLIVRHVINEGGSFKHAVMRPRLHHQLIPMEVEYEADFDASIISALRARGHATTELGSTAGFAAVIGAVRDPDGYLSPQTDRRRIGSMDGF
ncbi:glutathione hydrolase 1 proenzyme-like [Ostrinia furnacalis]|uniref:glutathione hydrolase 1 proenzyme-like n=1 Tax=Ostrinia furnacalis TaxID=93504 RepID=UPI00103998A6|nr:glutathione hydrolase 1 proenzyme-like [Ostrinia furnacalis]